MGSKCRGNKVRERKNVYLDLDGGAFKRIKEKGENLCSNIFATCLLQNYVQILQNCHCRLDGLWSGEEAPENG